MNADDQTGFNPRNPLIHANFQPVGCAVLVLIRVIRVIRLIRDPPLNWLSPFVPLN